MVDRAFPKDVAAFEAVARCCGVDFPILRDVARVNDQLRSRFVDRVRGSLGTLAGKRIGVLGLSFKEDTDDVRESPAIAIVRELVLRGAVVRARSSGDDKGARGAAKWTDYVCA